MNKSFKIGTIVLIGIFFQLALQFLVIRFFGFGEVTDVYIAAQAVPGVIGAVLITALQSVWLPRLSTLPGGSKAWQGEHVIAQSQSLFLGGAVLVTLAMTIMLWLPLVFPNFSVQQIQTATSFSLILLLATLFNIQSGLLIISLRAQDKFILAESISTIGSLFSLVGAYYALPIWGIFSIVWVVLIRSILVYLIQMHIANWPSISFSK